MTASSESHLVARTLAAAADVTGGDVAAALDADGGRWLHGEPHLAARLADAASQLSAAHGLRPGGVTTAFADQGLPSAITMSFGANLLVVAAATEDRFGSDAGSLLALVVAHAHAGHERLRELQQLAQLADSDPLTGLRHHRPFEERLGASRPGRTAVLAVDVDDFKQINDQYGHQAGDVALVCLADALRSVLRGDDELYRIGGDEFAVVIEVNGPAEVVNIARRLLEAARRAGHTISVGAAVRVPGESGRETLRRADKALYQAKRSGRDTARLAA
jgi:diguanylate cyclase (GGDEF)-like protein